jgi:hypothetical protein
MYLFGGSNLENENTKFFSLDLATFKWELIRSRGDLPLTRDEHTAIINPNDNTMLIFGGFTNGERSNSLIHYSFLENKWITVVLPPTTGKSGSI